MRLTLFHPQFTTKKKKKKNNTHTIFFSLSCWFVSKSKSKAEKFLWMKMYGHALHMNLKVHVKRHFLGFKLHTRTTNIQQWQQLFENWAFILFFWVWKENGKDLEQKICMYTAREWNIEKEKNNNNNTPYSSKLNV